MGSMAVEEWGHRATHLWGLALHRYHVCRPHASSYESGGDLSPFKCRWGISPYYVSPHPTCGCEIGEPHRFILLRWHGTNMCSKRIGYVLVTRLEICLYSSMHHMGYTIASREFLDSAVIFTFFAPSRRPHRTLPTLSSIYQAE